MSVFNRIIWIVLDSVGIGELPDAADYGDVGRNTLGHIAESRPLIGMVHPRSRRSLWALIEIYRRLLARIEQSNFHVLDRRIRVPTREKLGILARAVIRRANTR